MFTISFPKEHNMFWSHWILFIFLNMSGPELGHKHRHTFTHPHPQTQMHMNYFYGWFGKGF